MRKILLFTLIGLFICCAAVAQQATFKQPNTTAYYMSNSVELAYDEKSAEFIRFIYKALPGEDTALVNITDYYRDGKTKLVARSYNNQMNFESGTQGYCLEFHENGHKKSVRNYNRGKLTGDAIEYYPNGRLYNIKKFDKDSVFLKDCLDSTGKVLVENGSGKWIKYDNDFKGFEAGLVVNGKEDGNWKGFGSDSASYSIIYNNGTLISGEERAFFGQKIFSKVDVSPRFKGGDAALGKYLAKNVRYIASAREHNIQGRVILTFVVEKDGRLTDIKVIRGIGGGLDEEALRVMKECPAWEPGMQNGKPVRVLYSIPISFSLKY